MTTQPDSTQVGPVPTPSLDDIRDAAKRVANHVLRTPTVRWPAGSDVEGAGEWWVKLELLQKTGSFKARGALNAVMRAVADGSIDEAGITAFSAGNHAIAVAYAGQRLGLPVKVVMPVSANPFRVDRCRALGAEIEFGATIADLMEMVARIQSEEGRVLIHPFEGVGTIEGTATIALELAEDLPQLDAVIVPVGGGGLIAGIASGLKQLQPQCQIIGVEPEGACGMHLSLAAGYPLDKVHVNTIADSLGAPLHAPISYSLIEQHVDDMVKVSDDQLREAMRQMFVDMKLAAEPACAAAWAALAGPLMNSLAGKRVAMVACGSNIDIATWSRLVGETDA